MAEIRPLERPDLPAVARLMAARLPGWNQDESFLAATLLDQRWGDAELPSLVAVDADGSILGFIGGQVRRLRLDDRVLRGVCSSHLVVVDDRRAGPAGALLLRRLLGGGQDLTWTDTASETAARMWRTFGGQVDFVRSFDWMLVVRPVRWVREMLTARLGGRSLRALSPARTIPMQLAGARFAPDIFPKLPEAVRGDDATAGKIMESLDELTRDVRLRVDYDEEYLGQLFTQIDATAGGLVCRLVSRDGVAIGWYAYLCRPGGASRMLHLCGPDAEIDSVLAELVQHARGRGTAVLTGRFEPHLSRALGRRGGVMGLARGPMIHSRELEVRALLATDSSLLTDLDGEWFAI
jgi:hypothetical protein